MSKLDDEPGSKINLYERKRRRIMTSKRGVESKTLQTRGLRRGVHKYFLNDDGAPDIEAFVEDGKNEKAKMHKRFARLSGEAENLFDQAGDKTFRSYCSDHEDEHFGANEYQRYAILGEMWTSEIVSKYGPVSKEAYAAFFLARHHVIVRDYGVNDSLRELILSLCEAYYFWRSEADKEHQFAFYFKRNIKPNLRKAAESRTKVRLAKFELVEDAVKEFWKANPNYTGNRIKTAKSIIDQVNRRLTETELGAYTEGSLASAIGKILKSGVPTT